MDSRKIDMRVSHNMRHKIVWHTEKENTFFRGVPQKFFFGLLGTTFWQKILRIAQICVYEAFNVNCPSAAREHQIGLYPVHVYGTKTYIKEFYDNHF